MCKILDDEWRRKVESDNEDVVRKAKIEACGVKVSNTVSKLKKLIAPNRYFDDEKGDPVLALWDEVVVNGAVFFAIFMAFGGILSACFLHFPLFWACFFIMCLSPLLVVPPPCKSFKRYFSNRMRKKFTKNQDEIHVLEGQLLTLLEESKKLAESEDWGTPVDALYGWFVSADLPMSDAAREIFKYEILRNEKESKESKIRDSVYSSESEWLQKLMNNAEPNHKSSLAMNDQHHLIYASRNDELNAIVSRINEISDDMEESQSGSGRNFVAEMKTPFDSLVKLNAILDDELNDMEMSKILCESVRLFNRRLDREEARIKEVKIDQAKREYLVLEGLIG